MSKDSLIAEVEAYARGTGIPFALTLREEEDFIDIDMVCPHGVTLMTQILNRVDDSDLWDWNESTDGEFCGICYKDGPIRSRCTPKLSKANPVGRNDPCPCGSGKKYKKCCGK